MRAPNAGVVLLVERIVRDVIRINIRPNLLPGPRSQGIDFHQLKSLIPFYEPSIRSCGRLIASNARDPG